MRRSTKAPLIGLFLLCASLSLYAGDTLSVRVVEASQVQTRGVDPRIKDIEPVLRKQLSYVSYSLLDAKETALPADGTLNLAGGLQVVFKGSQDNLSLVVRRNDKEVLNSAVELQDNKPLILGGFPGKTGKLLIVILAK